MPAMDSALANPAQTVTAFAAGQSLLVVPGIPSGGPVVPLSPGTMSLQDFLALSKKIGDGALYLKAGQGDGGKVTVAFASSSGLLHLWSHGS